ncbi:unnamed protein product [Pieris macdunnoughi]|uniref:Uncharacterized protein n=1 Tax=Pieris macdunnoughi TaxID=345717 RepID=A0A821LMS9_9NEOP|nr:unnamed protein product [Pieris macdunnoughi]
MIAVALGVWLCALAWPGVGASVHCALRREISPCTCRREDAAGAVLVLCQRISSYRDVARALTDKFSPDTKIGLDISHSRLPDFADHTFRDLGLSMTKLKLNFDNLSELRESVFTKLELLDYLSLADNSLAEMPRHVLRHLPHVRTLDLCRNNITQLAENDFKDIQELEHLLLADNQIARIERHAFPKGLKHIHLGINKLHTLNGALRDLDRLEWIFINANHLKSIENELPVRAKRLTLVHAAHNGLRALPGELWRLPALDSLYAYDNRISALGGALGDCRRLVTLSLSFNDIQELASDEFAGTESLADLDLAYNRLSALNGSLRALKSLRYLNLTHNALTQFSMHEIRGLRRLYVIDLSHNKINQLTGHIENLVDIETRVLEVRLDHNGLEALGGALGGVRGLLRLTLAHNRLRHLTPADLAGLDELRLLDVSYNHIVSLEDASKAILPRLEELNAHHNDIVALNEALHGLPALCTADFSHNRIETVDNEVASKSRCTINGVPGVLKIYLQDNPVLCEERVFELAAAVERAGARLSGDAVCAASKGLEALNDGGPDAPVIVVARVGPAPDPDRTLAPGPLFYRRARDAP